MSNLRTTILRVGACTVLALGGIGLTSTAASAGGWNNGGWNNGGWNNGGHNSHSRDCDHHNGWNRHDRHDRNRDCHHNGHHR
jgi:hypothetical protein